MASQASAGPGNPLTGTYKTSDDRFVCFVMLQAFKYWPDFCAHVDHPEWAEDARFDSHEKLASNAGEARALITDVIATRTLAEWTERFATLAGQWAPVQNTLEVAADPQMRANGYMATAATKEGVEFELVASPVQFDEQPTPTARGPEFNEHGDEILASLGYDEERILALKMKGAVT